jgi:hypothetical protein
MIPNAILWYRNWSNRRFLESTRRSRNKSKNEIVVIGIELEVPTINRVSARKWRFLEKITITRGFTGKPKRNGHIFRDIQLLSIGNFDVTSWTIESVTFICNLIMVGSRSDTTVDFSMVFITAHVLGVAVKRVIGDQTVVFLKIINGVDFASIQRTTKQTNFIQSALEIIS